MFNNVETQPRHGDATQRASNQAMRKRAVTASVVALALCGSGYLWHDVSTGRTLERAEQARVAQLQLTPRQSEALARETKLQTAAAAFAERLAAGKQAEAQRTAEEDVRVAEAGMAIQSTDDTELNAAPRSASDRLH